MDRREVLRKLGLMASLNSNKIISKALGPLSGIEARRVFGGQQALLFDSPVQEEQLREIQQAGDVSITKIFTRDEKVWLEVSHGARDVLKRDSVKRQEDVKGIVEGMFSEKEVRVYQANYYGTRVRVFAPTFGFNDVAKVRSDERLRLGGMDYVNQGEKEGIEISILPSRGYELQG